MLAAIPVANLASLWCPSFGVIFGPKLDHQTLKMVIWDHLGDPHLEKTILKGFQKMLLSQPVFSDNQNNEFGKTSNVRFAARVVRVISTYSDDQ